MATNLTLNLYAWIVLSIEYHFECISQISYWIIENVTYEEVNNEICKLNTVNLNVNTVNVNRVIVNEWKVYYYFHHW